MSKHSKRARAIKDEAEKCSQNPEPACDTPQELWTFARLKEQYGEFSQKRPRYIKYGILSIFILPVVFLVLMFSLESKLIFLALWIVSIIACAVFLIVVEYKDYWYRQLLGLDKEKEAVTTEEPKVTPPPSLPDGGGQATGDGNSEAGQIDSTEAVSPQEEAGKKSDAGPEDSAVRKSKEENAAQGEKKA